MGTSTEENLWESDIEKLLEIDVHTYPSYDHCASAQDHCACAQLAQRDRLLYRESKRCKIFQEVA